MQVPQTPQRFTPHSHFASDRPILYTDGNAPMCDLHACVNERLNAALKYLNLMACTTLSDYAANDINTVTNIARILIQDVADVFAVIERRGLED